MSNWRPIWLDFPDVIPKEPACYAILVSGRVVYVGQTSNLQARFRGHRFRIEKGMMILPWGSFPQHLVTAKARFGRRYGDWAMRELRLIMRLQPHFNVKSKGRAVA